MWHQVVAAWLVCLEIAAIGMGFPPSLCRHMLLIAEPDGECDKPAPIGGIPSQAASFGG